MNQRHHDTHDTSTVGRMGRMGRLGRMGAVTATLAATLAATSAAFTGPAQAADRAPHMAGHRSLVQVLSADKGYDHNWQDFDVLEKAVGAVLAAKPDSAVKVLADGRTRVTAFLPTDRAFRRLANDLTGRKPHTERGTFRAIAHAADVDTIETILLYHVVPGVTAGSHKVARMNGAALTMANGGQVTVRIRGGNVRLADQDPDARNAAVVAVDINKGNKQIAHAINRVLRPIDL